MYTKFPKTTNLWELFFSLFFKCEAVRLPQMKKETSFFA